LDRFLVKKAESFFFFEVFGFPVSGFLAFQKEHTRNKQQGTALPPRGAARVSEGDKRSRCSILRCGAMRGAGRSVRGCGGGGGRGFACLLFFYSSTAFVVSAVYTSALLLPFKRNGNRA
jgi:hypothetical protein